MKNTAPYKKLFKACIVMAACMSLTACYQTVSPELAVGQLNQPAFKASHPISVKAGHQKINLMLPKDSGGLNAGQTAVAAQFILDYIDKGEGQFEIWQPNGNLNKKAVKAAHQKIRRILYDAAIPANAITYRKYDAFGEEDAAIGLRFKRYYANTAKCGFGNQNLAVNYKNENYKNFGCAYQNNIAAMVSNPKDLISPSTVSDSSAARRQIIWNKYIQGTPTGADRSSDERISISGIGK